MNATYTAGAGYPTNLDSCFYQLSQPLLPELILFCMVFGTLDAYFAFGCIGQLGAIQTVTRLSPFSPESGDGEEVAETNQVHTSRREFLFGSAF